jgi:hypothetical protein
MRWHYRDPQLVWLLVLSYLLHVIEEWLGNFPEWLARIDGDGVSRQAFVVINAIALVVMIAGARAAIRREAYGWIAIGIGTLLLVNAVAHLLGTLYTGVYSPGLITGIVLYLPLGQLTLLRAWSQAHDGLFAAGVAAGLAVQAAVSLIAFSI